jgi:hypothetical protein
MLFPRHIAIEDDLCTLEARFAFSSSTDADEALCVNYLQALLQKMRIIGTVTYIILSRLL